MFHYIMRCQQSGFIRKDKYKMGMDYQYAGSASYPRFDKEILDIVQQVFGGAKSTALQQTEDEVSKGSWVTKMFGTMSSMKGEDKYIFPDNIPEHVAYFFNHLYDRFNPEFMEDVYSFIEPRLTNMEEISNQFVCELQMVHECGADWHLG